MQITVNNKHTDNGFCPISRNIKHFLQSDLNLDKLNMADERVS